MSLFYVLDGHTPVPEPDIIKYCEWRETADRRVDLTYIDGEREAVSTVFLGINHNFMMPGPPALFETMVIGGYFDGEYIRTSTWEEAEAAHRQMVEMVMAGQVLTNHGREVDGPADC